MKIFLFQHTQISVFLYVPCSKFQLYFRNFSSDNITLISDIFEVVYGTYLYVYYR